MSDTPYRAKSRYLRGQHSFWCNLFPRCEYEGSVPMGRYRRAWRHYLFTCRWCGAQWRKISID